ncbi:MAG: serine/threonine protein kinase [Deltaproteobacteria bacterium]|nr:serine/threonine protein kinase [Deltaproteobacteria bacterium]
MTTRDPRSPHSSRSRSGVERERDPTQSLNLDPADEVGPSSMAIGTHGDEGTKVDSPQARARPPQPKRPPPVPDRNNADDPEERVGTQLGSYRVAEVLGKGGMGFVYRAEHVKLGREVALKLLRRDYASRRDAVARFIQEARTVNRIRHRNIVDVPDIVELEDGTTFIVMEFLRGQSLGKWARSGVDLPRALAVLVQICDGLSAAHAVGVVHRDLKPDNVIVVPTSDGAELVKLLDFGVAKLLNRDDEDVGFQTAAGSVIGTPAYMSPEQAGGMTIDARSDTYSLGAIMYELFTGQPMFRGRSFGEYVRKHLTERPTPPRQTQGGADVDPHLEFIILKCLEKEPSMRFNNIVELRDALISMLGSMGMETNPPGFPSLTGSMIRISPSTIVPLVNPPSAQVGQLAPPGYHSQASAVINPSASYIYGQHSSQIVPPTGMTQPSTPWWAWFVGGAVAVSIGIGAALWYANSGAPLTMSPSATPIIAPLGSGEATPAKLLALRFDSLPSGGVYADGRSAELCRTPCSFDVDTAEGLARKFIVRSEGYKDASIHVDLSAAPRDFQVTLEQLPPAATIPTVPTAIDPVTADVAPDKVTSTAKKPNKRPTAKDRKLAADKLAADKLAADKAAADKAAADKAAALAAKPARPDPEPEKPKRKPDRSDKIDSSETLDPFKRKR